MIITRTPLRISFFGGGTDYPVWYKANGGAVLSTTINKYIYISCRYLPPFFSHNYRIRYTLREETQTVDEIKHPSVRECLKYLEVTRGIEMVHISDIPAQSGVGSSSAFTVGLLNALYALKGKMVTKRQLSREAIHVEQSLIKENVGSQDQVAAAFGGLNKIDFGNEREFYVNPVTVSSDKIQRLQDHLMLFFTGLSRTASEIAGEQIRQTPSKTVELRELAGMVDIAVDILNGGSDSICDFGRLLHESWEIKRNLTKLISTQAIDDIYGTARRAGAIGGKLLGAGGGGFILLFAEPEVQPRLRAALPGLVHVPFAFENLGSQVIMYTTDQVG